MIKSKNTWLGILNAEIWGLKIHYAGYIFFHLFDAVISTEVVLLQAESIPDDGTCGNRVVSLDGTGANDAVERELLIEVSGTASVICSLNINLFVFTLP